MRIAICHSFYSAAQPSGENRVVEDQVLALREAGHEVLLVRQDTDSLMDKSYGIRTAFNVATGNGFNPISQLNSFRPDIVHVHNLFPNFGTAWVEQWQGPVVVSLHNYRAVCSNGLFFRSGQICTECSSNGPIRALLHACYRDSRFATLPLALSRSKDIGRILAGADTLVTTSELSAEVISEYVAPGIRTVVIPNFGSGDGGKVGVPIEPRTWIAVGRFSPEKGFVELVREWPDTEKLVIIGDGPEGGAICSAAEGKTIEVHSSVPRKALRELMSSSFGLVFPSRWFEADPQVVVEAMRVGLPVVSYYVNSVSHVLEETEAGSIYGSYQDLDSALGAVMRNRDAMSVRALLTFESRWTKEEWLLRIEKLYGELIGPSTGTS